MDNKVKIALILGFAVIGYALIGRQTKLEIIKKQNEEEALRMESISRCLSAARANSRSWWMNNCENHGINIERNDANEITSCSLPGYLSNRIKDTEQEEKDRCVDKNK